MSPDSITGDRTKTHPTKQDPGLTYALRRLHHDETALTAHLTQTLDQHRNEHEIHHVTRDLLAWSHQNLTQIAETVTERQIDLNPQSASEAWKLPGPALAIVDAEPGLRLLEDLRTTYLLASATSLSWELLAQYAQARHENGILDVAQHCHPRTLRQMRWANTMLKTQSPQILTSFVETGPSGIECVVRADRS